MTFGRRVLVIGIAIVVGLFAASMRESATSEPSAGSGSADLTQPIATDPELRIDSLPNGLRSYIREYGKRGDPIELRLVVNAGSVLEDEDQRGFAHAVEHLAIRGSTRFPRRALDAFMARLGMRSGEGVNGSTSADHTEYRLTLPSDSGGVLDTAIAMLSGIAYDASFDPAEARIEAGIVMEEWRGRRTFEQRRDDAESALLFEGSTYAVRPPIGDTTVLRRFDLEPLRRFYRTWYRPERMAIIAVGGFNPYTVEALIKQHFSAAPPVTGAAPTGARDTLRSGTLRAAVHADHEATGSRVSVSFPRPASRYVLNRDLREAFVRSLWRDILVDRLERASLQPGASIVDVSADLYSPVRNLRAETVTATVSPDGVREAIEAIIGTNLQLARTVVPAAELEESVQLKLHDMEGSHENGDSRSSLVEEYEDHFLTGNVPVTQDTWYEAARTLLPDITAADIMRYAASLDVDSGAVIVVSAHPQDPATKMTAADVVAIARAAAMRPAPAIDAAEHGEVVPRPSRRGSITTQAKLDSVDAFDWRLSNGIRVLLKPTDFSDGEVVLRAVLPGGSSLATGAHYPSAYLSDEVVRAVGVGSLPKARLDRRLELNSVSLSATVSDNAIVFDGSSATDEVADLLELLHAYATAPRRDTVAFRRYVERMHVFRRERARDPDEVFLDTLTAAIDGTTARADRHSSAFLDALTLDRALEFWRARFANSSGMTLVLTGDFVPSRVRRVIELYVASLPSGTPEQPRHPGVRFPSMTVQREFTSRSSVRARTTIALSGPYGATNEQASTLGAIRDLVQTAIETRLRETLGATYGVNTTMTFDVIPPARYVLQVDFESAPDRMNEMVKEVLQELQRLSTDGPTEEEFESVRATGARDVDDRIESNDYWASELSSHARLGWSFPSILGHRAQRADMTREELRRACVAWIRPGTYVRVTRRPAR